MPDNASNFPHLPLRLAKQGIAASLRGVRQASPRTAANQGDAGGHGSRLKSSVDLITTNWQEEQDKRKEEGKPDLPNAVSFILHVDPDSFDADSLKSFGIEVVADLEEGYIIGASADTELSGLRKKIEQFINSERGGGRVPEIWELIEGTRRPEYILSDALKDEWDQIQDNQEYIVDVGISCVDIQEQYSLCPKRRESETNQKFQERVERWLDKYNLTLHEWDDLYQKRSEQLEEFVYAYEGEILRNSTEPNSGISRLPDSFSCRISISGKGLRDLVLNFPYIFDVYEYKVSSRTAANIEDSESHGSRLKSSADLIVANWNKEQKQRQQEGKPILPDIISFILQIDPDTFDAEALSSFGIEIVADLEEGYIIGASADTGLSELRKKIEKFIKSERNGSKVPGVWKLIEGTRRPEYILSERLKAEWDQITDNQEYIVDVGISCIDIQHLYSQCPKRKELETDENFQERVEWWLDKHSLTPQEWDTLYLKRSDQLEEFVYAYEGEILHNFAGVELGVSRLPDSFSCRIRISGKGLRDLVLNFPYIFDVSEYEDIALPPVNPDAIGEDRDSFVLGSPEPGASRVCIIDSGIEERHPLLKAAIDYANSRSWVPGEFNQTADYVPNGGHGTRVAGAVIYPRGVPRTGQLQPICWLQNARILNRDNHLPKNIFPPEILEEIVDFYFGRTRTCLFNHSITSVTPYRTQFMTAWAAAIDKLTWNRAGDLLLIVAAGNLNGITNYPARPAIKAHLDAGRDYPDYLLSPSTRIANPGQSLQALTVGSIAHTTYDSPSVRSLADADYPSAFSCTGLGIWGTIKPEVVEYGGDLVIDSNDSPNFSTPEAVCPELVRAVRNGGKVVGRDTVGTSFAAPKVTHIAAALAAEFPEQNALLYRALIVQSARLPSWTEETVEKLYYGLRTMGYGIPNIDRALGNSHNRITLTTPGNEYIKARQAKVYQVQIPEFLLREGEGFDIRIEITLSYVAEPRRTRRNRRKYLSTWLDWACSKRGEDPDAFLAKVLKEYDQASSDAEEGEGGFPWTLGKRQARRRDDGTVPSQGIDGIVKEVSRSAGTIQKDWAIVKSYDLREGFCIAVVGHEGWNKDPEATVPYCLVVSFEAVNPEVHIYEAFAQIQQPLQVQPQQQVNVTVS
ncbi:S8 family peptidase [Phormidium sp. FACHB-1136]|uniref:S8 family peptidase n=1 Tax=Phormidium sp. FACHB-1136 TaxID=2692848 RepID=UPI001688DBB3|nr:S8 family peptidase [Phormidium sp. FACHB-1136]MBD2426842.1 S8 family peptidase [Phormidium sp. FACHB-1136]